MGTGAGVVTGTVDASVVGDCVGAGVGGSVVTIIIVVVAGGLIGVTEIRPQCYIYEGHSNRLA